MVELINSILQAPLYVLLFGGGGILVVIVAVISVIVTIKKKKKQDGSITVKNSKKTEIKNNVVKGTAIDVEKSEDTVVSGNK